MTSPPSLADVDAMQQALLEAHEAMEAGEVPVGAVVTRDGHIVSRAQNRMVRDADATAHAELLAIRAAAQLVGSSRLQGCALYVTLEPCAMCAGGIVLARVDRLVFGAWDDKAGMCGSVGDIVRHPKLNHSPEVLGGVNAQESATMLRHFFEQRRVSAGR